jgi:hypothetical protein
VTGTVYYYRDSTGGGAEPTTKPVPNVGIDSTQDATADATTSSSGAYSLASLFGNVSVTTLPKYGTPRASDHNGAITGTDAAQIARAAVGVVTFTANQRVAGDVTGNGTLSSLDAAQVARFAVLLVDHFDVTASTNSDWKFLRCDTYPGACGAPAYDFTPLSQAESGKDFYAVLYGDVTGNWQPAGSFTAANSVTSPEEEQAIAADRELAARLRADAPSLPVRSAASPAARLSIEGSLDGIRPGERRQVAIAVANADGIVALDLDLTLDPASLSLVEIQATGLGTGYGVARRETSDGKHRIAAYGVTPLSGSGSVLLVTVEGRGKTGRADSLQVSGTANEGGIPLKPSAAARPNRTPRTPARTEREGSAR